MLYAKGSRVRLIHTGDVGTVEQQLDDGMVAVRLEADGSVIPVFIENIVRLEEARSASVRARIVPGKQDKTPKPPPRSEVVTQYTILKPQGVQIAFDPVVGREGQPERYRVFLLNDTRQPIIYSIQLFVAGQPLWKSDSKLEGVGYRELGEILYGELSDLPEIDLQVWPLLATGTGSRHHRRMRIKPKQFFNRVLTAPFLNRKVHLFRIFERLEVDKAGRATEKEDLRDYTRRNQVPAQRPSLLRRPAHEVHELAHFEGEIDLHIERLVGDPRRLDRSQILQTQLAYFDDYLAKAVRLGVDRFFVIHGIGEGKLRQAIHQRLRDHPYVSDFRNEYHAKYGWGATEVIL